ncbi:MAG: hypothetical protein INH37_13615 [Myxococcaceae bacterium]|nr:hypothetical protein [Myxococcaceae bacterium]
MSDKLQVLLDGLIAELGKRIKEGTASPSDLNVARQLLKDNNISFKETHPGAAELMDLKNLPFDPNEPPEVGRPN